MVVQALHYQHLFKNVIFIITSYLVRGTQKVKTLKEAVEARMIVDSVVFILLENCALLKIDNGMDIPLCICFQK